MLTGTRIPAPFNWADIRVSIPLPASEARCADASPEHRTQRTAERVTPARLRRRVRRSSPSPRPP